MVALQGKQVGLACDGVGKLDDISNSIGSKRQLSNSVVGIVSLRDALTRYLSRILNLSADFVDRWRRRSSVAEATD